MEFESLKRLVLAEDWEEIESARGPRVAPHSAALIGLYHDLDSWPQRLAVVQLLQDQPESDALRGVMLDILRAPNVSTWLQDTVELTKAVALGFVDERYDTFMKFYNDRSLLARSVAEALTERGLEQEPDVEAPAVALKAPAETFVDAIADGDTASVQQYILDGVDLDAHLTYGQIKGVTPLILALIEARFDIARLLLNAGAQPDARRDGSGQSPLMWATLKGERELAVSLMERGAALENIDSYGESVVKCAAQNGRLDILEDAIARGADVHAAYRDGRTAISFAILNGEVATTLRLLDAGVDVNDTKIPTPALHLACSNNHARLVTELVEHGADLNLADSNGRTPLMIAAQEGYANIVKSLLKTGADPALTDRSGKRAVDHATGRRAEQVRAALEP